MEPSEEGAETNCLICNGNSNLTAPSQPPVAPGIIAKLIRYPGIFLEQLQLEAHTKLEEPMTSSTGVFVEFLFCAECSSKLEEIGSALTQLELLHRQVSLFQKDLLHQTQFTLELKQDRGTSLTGARQKIVHELEARLGGRLQDRCGGYGCLKMPVVRLRRLEEDNLEAMQLHRPTAAEIGLGESFTIEIKQEPLDFVDADLALADPDPLDGSPFDSNEKSSDQDRDQVDDDMSSETSEEDPDSDLDFVPSPPASRRWSSPPPAPAPATKTASGKRNLSRQTATSRKKPKLPTKSVPEPHKRKEAKRKDTSKVANKEEPLDADASDALQPPPKPLKKRKRHHCTVEGCTAAFQHLTSLQGHLRMSHPETNPPGFQCPHCDYSSSNRTTFNAHVKKKHEDPLLACTVPGCSFQTRGALRMKHHVEGKHEGKRNAVCPQCGKTFYSKARLSHHMRCHGEKKFQCGTCGKRFIMKHKMRDHEKKEHSTERPHICELCGFRFPTTDTLYSHRLTWHKGGSERIGEQPYRRKRYNTDVSPDSRGYNGWRKSQQEQR